MTHPARVLALLFAAVLGMVTLTSVSAVAQPTMENRVAPVIFGKAEFGKRLLVSADQWSSAPTAATYQWLRSGEPINGATLSAYRPALKDLGRRLSVRVMVVDAEGNAGEAISRPTSPIQRAMLANRVRPKVVGVQRFTRAVRATPGAWSPRPARTAYQWLRDGKPIKGATKKRYTFGPSDVNKRIRVRVTVTAPGHRATSQSSAQRAPVGHRVRQRRGVTYSISTRGRITTSVQKFASQAAQTFADPRGWRGGGTTFRRVKSGGSFTLVLSAAGQVPSFSSHCSSYFSCRVGRFVVINQDRWKSASPSWNVAGRSLRDYRHLVINHEVGHWLGRSHARCSKRGQLAPVMGQQSKGTGGCRFNPWPRRYEY